MKQKQNENQKQKQKRFLKIENENEQLKIELNEQNTSAQTMQSYFIIPYCKPTWFDVEGKIDISILDDRYKTYRSISINRINYHGITVYRLDDHDNSTKQAFIYQEDAENKAIEIILKTHDKTTETETEAKIIGRLEEERWHDRPDMEDLKQAMGENTHGHTLQQDQFESIWFKTPTGETLPISIQKEADGHDIYYICRVG